MHCADMIPVASFCMEKEAAESIAIIAPGRRFSHDGVSAALLGALGQ